MRNWIRCLLVFVVLGTAFGNSEVRAEVQTLSAENSKEAAVLEADSAWKSRTPEQWAAVLQAAVDENETEKSTKKTSKKSAAKKQKKQNAAPSIQEQWYAAYALGKYGPDAKSAIPVLQERFAAAVGKDDDVRACVIFALGHIGDVKAFPTIAEAFDSEFPTIQRTAALVLAQFPEELAKEENAELVKKMETILREFSELQIPLASNCAAALWTIGKTDLVREWVEQTVHWHYQDSFTMNFRIYQMLSALHQIVRLCGAEALLEGFAANSNDSPSLPENLLLAIFLATDADADLSAAELLTAFGKASLESIRPKTLDLKKGELDPVLVRVLAQIDADSQETQEFLLKLFLDKTQTEKIRLTAIRGMTFFPEEKHEEVIRVLVDFLNDTENAGILVVEAQLALKKLRSTKTEETFKENL